MAETGTVDTRKEPEVGIVEVQKEPADPNSFDSACAICTEEKYSLRVLVEHEKCFGCGRIICYDCYEKGKPCMICKSPYKNHFVDCTIQSCNRDDMKHQPFKCKQCGDSIPRRSYMEHKKLHEECKCDKKCPIVKVKCKQYQSLCTVFKHSENCDTCEWEYCCDCKELYDEHETIPCFCNKGKMILCRNTKSLVNHCNCNIFETYRDDSVPRIIDFCQKCGFYKKDEHKKKKHKARESHNCAEILETVKHYDQFRKAKQYLEKTQQDHFGIVEPKDNPAPSSSYQKIPASSQK